MAKGKVSKTAKLRQEIIEAQKSASVKMIQLLNMLMAESGAKSVAVESYQEYDDNNYFTASKIVEFSGFHCDVQYLDIDAVLTIVSELRKSGKEVTNEMVEQAEEPEDQIALIILRDGLNAESTCEFLEELRYADYDMVPDSMKA